MKPNTPGIKQLTPPSVKFLPSHLQTPIQVMKDGGFHESATFPGERARARHYETSGGFGESTRKRTCEFTFHGGELQPATEVKTRDFREIAAEIARREDVRIIAAKHGVKIEPEGPFITVRKTVGHTEFNTPYGSLVKNAASELLELLGIK